jgi:hypothetical protein
MEDSLIALGAQAVKQGGAWANKTEIEEIKADVSQHLVSTQVRIGLSHSRRIARG